MYFKMVENAAETSKELATWYEVNREPIGERLGAKWRNHGLELEIGDSVNFLMYVVETGLRSHRDELCYAAGEHEAVVVDEKVSLDDRKEADSELREMYVTARNLYSLTVGKEQAGEVGFENKVAKSPRELDRQVRRLITTLEKTPSPERLDDRALPGIVINHTEIALSFRNFYDRLHDALEATDTARATSNSTLAPKAAAMRRLCDNIREATRFAVTLSELAGRPGEAPRLRALADKIRGY